MARGANAPINQYLNEISARKLWQKKPNLPNFRGIRPMRKFAQIFIFAQKGLPTPLCIGSRPLNGNIYWMSPLSFSRSSISVPLTFFRSTLSISFSLKDSGASLMGFLSMA